MFSNINNQLFDATLDAIVADRPLSLLPWADEGLKEEMALEIPAMLGEFYFRLKDRMVAPVVTANVEVPF